MKEYKKLLVQSVGNVACVDDTIDEQSLAPGSVLIKNEYTLVSAGTELACIAGQEDWFALPGVPGYCGAGRIIAAAGETGGYNVGDAVYHNGGHQGLQIYKAPASEQSFIAKIPGGLDAKYAPFAMMASIAMTAVRVSDIEIGDKVAVVGLGVVGNLAAQFATLQGAEVTAIDPSPMRRAAAQSCGIETLDPDAGDFAEKMMEITGGAGFETIIEASGITKLIAMYIPFVKRRGELILLGTPRSACSADILEMSRRIHLADCDVTIRGAHEVKYPLIHTPFVKHSRQRNTDIIFDLIKRGKLKIPPLISLIASPDDAASIYETLKATPEKYLGVLYEW